MKNFQRLQCAINNNDTIKHLYTFNNFPISMNCVTTPVLEDKFFDQHWGISSSGHLQLMNLLDPELIYHDYHNPGTVGKTWREHHYNFYSFIDRDYYKDVLEIGGASGLLAENFSQSQKDFRWTIIEPNKKRTLDDARINFVEGFFETWDTDQKFDTVIHSHVFEHAYDPVDFLLKANSLLKQGGYQYISIPNMHFWLSNNFTNTLSFEHTFYVDQNVLTYLLYKTGFTPIEWLINDHSIFVKAMKQDSISNIDLKFDYIKPLFEKYILNLKTDILNIQNKLKDNYYYLFGAHIFAQSLFNLGLDQNKVINLLDNDPHKQNKRLYGTNCMVKSPKCLEGVTNPIVVLRGGSYTKEITESLLHINPTTIIL